MKKILCLLIIALLFGANTTYAKKKKSSKKKKSNSGELLLNGDFSGGLDDWRCKPHSEYDGMMKSPTVKKGVFSVTVPYASVGYYVSLNQDLPELDASKAYKLTFEAKAKGEGKTEAKVTTQMVKSGKKRNVTAGASVRINANDTWERYTLYFNPKYLSSEYPQSFGFYFGSFKGTVQVKNVSLSEAKDKTVSNAKKGDLTVEAID